MYLPQGEKAINPFLLSWDSLLGGRWQTGLHQGCSLGSSHVGGKAYPVWLGQVLEVDRG